MSEHILTELAIITALGIGAQWLAWRLRLPSILLLLLFGFLAGPILGWLAPDKLLGDLLFPVVSLAVAIILFEGGLSLKLQDLKQIGHIVRNLITLGVLVTWATSTVAAIWLLDFNPSLALLFGAVLVVTGPTVIIPLLRHISPLGRIGSIAKWEGIMIDPVGALLAVLVFEGIWLRGIQDTSFMIVKALAITVFVGSLLGFLAARTMVFLLKRYWIPDFLQEIMALMFVITLFTLSDHLQAESGLFSVTVMGIILANQQTVNIKHIAEFKENLQVLFLSGIFVILAARLDLQTLAHIGWQEVLFIIFLFVVSRPLSVFLSTIKSGLSWQEKTFLSWLAPRGIVAIAVISVFSLRLEERGYQGAEQLVPLMFLIITSTVTIYGLTAKPLARVLRLAHPNPQGILIVGAHSWARKIAMALKKEAYDVLVVDTNRANIAAARLEGLRTFIGSILADSTIDRLDLGGIGRLVSLTPNNEVNSLAVIHFKEIFGVSNVYQLPPQETSKNQKEIISSSQQGRHLFTPDCTFNRLSNMFTMGAVIKKTQLSENFTFDQYKEHYKDRAIPMFLINEDKSISIFSTDANLKPKAGQAVLSIVLEDPEKQKQA
ncbi:hypothetical protein GF406_16870 [candidate division KSB1 bacterium]|nr:hypothetical protein [candidate division KSB1 bacterium]